MTLTPSGQIAAVIVGVVGGAILAGKTNRLLGAIGGGTLGLVVPYVIWPPTPAPPTVSSPGIPAMTPQVSTTPSVLEPVPDTGTQPQGA
jgi:hypothetical protein